MKKSNFTTVYTTGFQGGRDSCFIKEVVKFGTMCFKLTSECGNCYCHCKVHVMEPSGVFTQVACELDLEYYCYVKYHDTPAKMERGLKDNIDYMENWIAAVYSDMAGAKK